MERILIVDDEINVLKALKRLLRSRYEVVIASSAREALELIDKEEIFPVIISDMRMPEMNGIDFFAKISQISPETSKILLTGYVDLDKVIEAINRGNIHRFAQKPWNDDDLLKIVEECFEKFKSKKTLHDQSVNDGLTGLLNHMSFIKKLEQLIVDGRTEHFSVYVLMLDIDFFKKVNDNFGHPTGDVVLREVAHTIKRSCRGNDLVGRYGGEEFIVALMDMTDEMAFTVAERIRTAGAKLLFEQQDLNITISGGLKVLEHETPLELVAGIKSVLV